MPRERKLAGFLRSWTQPLLKLLASVVLTLVLLEASVWLLGVAGVLPPEAHGADAASRKFWHGRHEAFGVWHHPNSSMRHQRECFDVEYRSNSVGARDAERSREASGPRVVVLGDSLIEGWGLPDEERVSNRLERDTGVPHLNFGMSHFGPYQSQLVYEGLASQFRHDAVLVSITPENDFLDLVFETSDSLAIYDYRFRPYLLGEYPDYQRYDHREPLWHRVVWRAWGAYRAFSYSRMFFAGKREKALRAKDPAKARLVRSKFYEFDERQFALLKYTLERIVEAAGSRKVAVVLAPLRPDLMRFAQSGSDPLSQRLVGLEDELGVKVVNLLPGMAHRTPAWQRYFFSCDFHWSSYGNAIAFQILRRELTPEFYPAS